jgi:hypothetical protein
LAAVIRWAIRFEVIKTPHDYRKKRVVFDSAMRNIRE